MRKRILVILKAIYKISNWTIIPKVYYKKYKDENFIVKMKNGIQIKLRTNSTDLQAFANVWLLEEYRRKGFEIKNDDVIIDIGAHIGLFTTYVSQYCKRGRIFSYEPIKENFELLNENIRSNNLMNVNSNNIAISDKNGIRKIFLSNDESGHSFYANGDKYVEVNTITLNEIIEQNDIQKCNFLKLDCEGAEFEILKGLSEKHYDKIEKICLEYHLNSNDSKKLIELKSKLKKMHYLIRDIPATPEMGILFAKKII